MLLSKLMKYLPLLLILTVVLACNNSSFNSSTPAATPEPPPIAMSASQLAQKYKTNELAADNEFRGKPLEVTGKLKAVKEVLGSISIDIDAGNYMTITCDVPSERRDQAAALKSGQTVTVIGTGNGLFGSTVVEMENCRVK